MRYLFIGICLFLVSLNVTAQGAYVPLGSYSMHILDRMEIKQGRLATPYEFNTNNKAFMRNNIALYADSFNHSAVQWSKQDQFNLEYLQNDNFEYSESTNTQTKKSLLGTGLFKHKAGAVEFLAPDYKIIINPIAYLRMEYDQSQKAFNYLNSRGVEIRGQLAKNLSFYTKICDEIQTLNSWNQQIFNRDSVVVGQTFLQTNDYKKFNYWLASGYISFHPNKYIDMQFGHGRNFLGNGYRSFFLSDYSPDNLFLRFNTHFWRINYTNIWGEVLDYISSTDGHISPKRHYYATTYANVNITKKLNIGLFQSISFQRDSGYTTHGYDPQYLNPIIFYKAVENSMNSPDKAILGLDFKYNFARHFSLYGQFAFSELRLSEIQKFSGWWGNKQAYQIGLKYIDAFGISNLDLQFEGNFARPYMYTSFTALNAYVNFNQNLAHPIGANFREGIAIVRYQPLNKLMITAKTIVSTYGNDTNGSNWGKDIRKGYYVGVNQYGNKIGQGVTTHLYIADISFSYMIWHNLFIDAAIIYRKTTSELPQFETETLNPSIGIRWNINYRGCEL